MTHPPFMLERTLFGFPIRAWLTPLDCGLHVLLTGGQRSHVGAVCLAQDGQPAAAAAYPGHREQMVAEQWASALSAQLHAPVTAACGIHYDNAAREQIEEVLAASEALLQQALQILKESGEQDEF